MEGLIFGGAYLRREICVSQSIGLGLACSGKEIYHFCFVLLCIRGQVPTTRPPGGLYSDGDLTEDFLRLGGLYLEGLIHGGAYFRNFTVLEMVILLKIKRRDFFFNETAFLFWCHAL